MASNLTDVFNYLSSSTKKQNSLNSIYSQSASDARMKKQLTADRSQLDKQRDFIESSYEKVEQHFRTIQLAGYAAFFGLWSLRLNLPNIDNIDNIDHASLRGKVITKTFLYLDNHKVIDNRVIDLTDVSDHFRCEIRIIFEQIINTKLLIFSPNIYLEKGVTELNNLKKEYETDLREKSHHKGKVIARE